MIDMDTLSKVNSSFLPYLSMSKIILWCTISQVVGLSGTGR